MRRIILLILLLITSYLFLFGYIDNFNQRNSRQFVSVRPIPSQKIYINEKITYDVNIGSFSLGTSVFQSLPKANFNGKEVNLMTFKTSLVNFSDTEIIYSDLETNLPIMVERFISAWPNSEKIVEEYNQNNFTVTIKKQKDNNQDTQVIKKERVINNAVLLPFYVRSLPIFNEGEKLIVCLPLEDFTVRMVGKDNIRVPAGEFLTYHFISEPRNFEIWITADEQKIPIKIKKTSGLGYTLAMREYLTMR